MRYLIDTNIVFGVTTGRNPIAARNLLNCRQGEIGLSMIVIHELYFGAYKSDRVAFNEGQVTALLKSFTLLPFEENDARHAGDIRARLKREGAPIGPLDTLIAGQARSRGLLRVSNNLKEFARVPGLDVVNWE